ncbi:MAG: ATP-binding protein, partial [Chloroflexaceae bacterium]|nr:ATP-binding protein [Chloroflexaceae bacterium]
MSAYIERIKIHNVHGIRNILELNLNQKKPYMLIYGYNGSGKTSLFRAIGDFFDASQSPRNIRDIKHRSQIDKPAEISLIIVDNNAHKHTFTWSDTVSPINHPQHQLLNDCKLSLGHLSYNDVLELSFAFRHQQHMEVFQYLQGVAFVNATAPRSRPLSAIQFDINTLKLASQQIPDELITAYNDTLENITQVVKTQANTYIQKYFMNDKLRINLRVDKPYDGTNKPEVQLTAVFDAKEYPDFFTFMNEALVSTIAFALYFASLKLVNPRAVKLLVLDDIHFALDEVSRSNLMKLICTEFNAYQVLFLSHDIRHCDELARTSRASSGISWDYGTLIDAHYFRRRNENLLDRTVVNTYIHAGLQTILLSELRKLLEERLFAALKIMNPEITIDFKYFASETMMLG